MKLDIDNFANNASIPVQFAFAKPDPETRLTLSDNRNPAIRWSGTPPTTRSLVLLCLDPDAVSKHDANREDLTLTEDWPRVDFFHWVMVDIAPDVHEISEGDCSAGITPRGKTHPYGPKGSRQGLNDYTGWFEGDADMEGQYYGYDGPCPPWNDERVHHYRFKLFATDLERCPVEGAFTGQHVLDAIKGHVIAEAECVGTYTLHPALHSTTSV